MGQTIAPAKAFCRPKINRCGAAQLISLPCSPGEANPRSFPLPHAQNGGGGGGGGCCSSSSCNLRPRSGGEEEDKLLHSSVLCNPSSPASSNISTSAAVGGYEPEAGPPDTGGEQDKDVLSTPPQSSVLTLQCSPLPISPKTQKQLPCLSRSTSKQQVFVFSYLLG